jgi:hypothetical protein
MNTFEKEIVWSSLELDLKTNELVEVEKKKILVFKELDKFDKKQGKFHFTIASIPNNLIETKDDFVIEPSFIYDLTKEFVNVMAIIDENSSFKESDKTELFDNSQALYFLGHKLLKEKITPFFLKFRKISV